MVTNLFPCLYSNPLFPSLLHTQSHCSFHLIVQPGQRGKLRTDTILGFLDVTQKILHQTKNSSYFMHLNLSNLEEKKVSIIARCPYFSG